MKQVTKLPILTFGNYNLTILNREDLEEINQYATWEKVEGNTICDDIRLKDKTLDFRIPKDLIPTSEFNGILLVGDQVSLDELKDKVTKYHDIVYNPTFEGFNGKSLMAPNLWIPFTYAPRGNFEGANLLGANLKRLRIKEGNVQSTNFKDTILEEAIFNQTSGSLENPSLYRESDSCTRFRRGPNFYGELDYKNNFWEDQGKDN